MGNVIFHHPTFLDIVVVKGYDTDALYVSRPIK